MSSSTSPSWQFWRPSGNSSGKAVAELPVIPIASTSAVTLEDLSSSTSDDEAIIHEEYSAGIAESGNDASTSTSASGRSELSDDKNTHLHSLTERKLEKAVLGRAVGLRQLVLLSNAFASRAKSYYATGAYGSQATSLSSGGHAYYDGEIDPAIVDLEDELDRKKREEDWLDSVLDEMLTDEMEQQEQEQEEAMQRSRVKEQDRDFSEPYVHLSIKDRRHNASAEPIPRSSLFLLRDALEHQPAVQTEDMFLLAVKDSGFLEPALIPLPLSTETSPDSSNASQDDSDDEETHVDILEEDEMFDMDDLPPLPDSDDGHSEPSYEQEDVTEEQSSPLSLAIDIVGTSISASREILSTTPELAYSANSINSFLTNLSSSPSNSLQLATPASSPVEAAFVNSRRVSCLSDALLCTQIGEHMQAAAPAPLTAETSIEVKGEKTEKEHKENKDETRRVVHPRPSMELVRYQPTSLGATSRSAASELVVPDSSAISTAPHRGIHALPKLPSSLLSTILGRNPVPYVTSVPASDRVISPDYLTEKATVTPTSIRSIDSVQLPIFLPYEVVKSLYDSVDFGTPPRSSSPVTTPFVTSATLPAYTTSSSASFADSEGEERSVRSAPTSPRKKRRSRSLSLMDVGNVTYDSSGSLLFSSLGLYDLAHTPALGGQHTTNAEVGGSEAILKPQFTTASFGRGIVRDWKDPTRREEGRSPVKGTGTEGTGVRSRGDSRSPSRFQLYQPA